RSEVDLLLRVLLAVEAHHQALAFDPGDEVHRPAPERGHVHERVAGVVHLEIDALILMAEEQLAAILEVAVDDFDVRLAEVRELVQELLFNLFKLSVDDLVSLSLVVVAEDEELLLLAELGREELVDERDVVVVTAHFEDLLAAEPELAIPAQALAHVVALFVLFTE